MERIINKKDFEKALREYQEKKDTSIKNFLKVRQFVGYAKTEELVLIEDLIIHDVDFWSIRFDEFQFRNCIFENCEFHRDVSIGACIFKDCKFKNIRFEDVHFSECDFINTEFKNCLHSYNFFSDTLFENTKFVDSNEMLEIYFGGCKIVSLDFTNCYLSHSRFEDFFDDSPNNWNFTECIVETSSFYLLNLNNTRFLQTILNQNSFNNCTLSSETIHSSSKSTAKEFSSIDFQTILQSSQLTIEVLNQCFGIQEVSIKEYLFGLTQKIEFQSVFISYSFQDREFASRLNSSLITKGVFTFLWEKDAPGGKGLKKIMKENIQKHDRILFIASENSIKSEACQFELSEGRRKQAKLWSEIFFPIHIDNYLFIVDKDDIKPNNVKEEYWENICELKEINSMDFGEFCSLNYNQDKYDNMIYKLIKELKR